MSITEFPKLFKRTSTGAIEQWRIWVDGSIIMSEHGQVGGKLQTNVDEVKLGKRKLTAEEQALSEAESKHTKQLKKGYVDSIKKAEAGETDDVIEGGILPMLAHKHKDQGHKIPFPYLVSRKYDGLRLIATIKDGVCTLWSRTRKPVESLPHIVQALEAQFLGCTLTLDGEAYNHDYKDNFEKITSLIRPQVPVDGHELVQYHIYDLVSKNGYEDRYKSLKSIITENDTLKLVESYLVNNEEEMLTYFGQFIEEGYEGLMVRNLNGGYENKRSYNLLKVKSMLDSEYPIINVVEGRGKMAGKAIFVCQTPGGATFNVKLKGKLDDLAKYLEDHRLWQNKSLTVQYQNLSTDKIPRFPVGLRIFEQF